MFIDRLEDKLVAQFIAGQKLHMSNFARKEDGIHCCLADDHCIKKVRFDDFEVREIEEDKTEQPLLGMTAGWTKFLHQTFGEEYAAQLEKHRLAIISKNFSI